MLSGRDKFAMVRNCEMLYGNGPYGLPLWQRNMSLDAYADVVVVEGLGRAHAASESWPYAGFTFCCWKNAKSCEAVASCWQASELAHHCYQMLKRRT